MKFRHLLILFLALFVITLFILFFLFRNKKETVSINGHKFNVEIVTTNEQMQRGLGGRKEMCQECGMMFDFKEPSYYGFWMKDMLFPLDIIWINDNKVVHIEKNIGIDFKEVMKPDVLANQVLEINGGLADKFAIKVGDSVN